MRKLTLYVFGIMVCMTRGEVDSQLHAHYIEDFNSYDLDKNGLIDPQEIRTVYHGTLLEEDLKAFWDAVDVDNEGFFDLEKYVDYALKQEL